MTAHNSPYESMGTLARRYARVRNMPQRWPQPCRKSRYMLRRQQRPTATETPMPDALLTPAQAAAYLHVSPRTLEKWRMQGGGPRYSKLVHRVVYTQLELDIWVAEQTRTSTSDPGPRPDPPPRAAVHPLPPRRRASRARY